MISTSKKTNTRESAATLANTFPAGEIAVDAPLQKHITTDRSALIRWVVAGVAVLGLVVFPLINSTDTFGINLLTQTLILSLFAMSLDMIMGYVGLTSFGHAVFYGVGGYCVGMMMTRFNLPDFWLSLVAALVVSAIVALVLGYFCIRTSGVYFFMLTLAFAQMFQTLATQWDALGSSDGFSLQKPDITIFGLSIHEQIPFYMFVLVCFLGGYFIMRMIVQSAFGLALIGIRDNEGRMSALGYQTRNFKLVAYMVSGALSGLAGALAAYFNGYIGPNAFDWGTSGMVMVMVLLGGKGTLIGPILGAFFINYLQSFLSSRNETFGTFAVSDRWYMVLGAIFIIFVLVAPNGLLGAWYSASGRVKSWLAKR
jgi:branched-chain amino acid transport system permease protein